MDPRYDVLEDAARLAREFVDSLPDRPVGARAELHELRERLARPLGEAGEDPRTVLADLARDVEPGLVASAGPRYFGFVIGGALPVAVGGGLADLGVGPERRRLRPAPARRVAEEVAARWVPRAARPARRLRRRVRDRLPDGPRHLPGRRAPRRPARRRLGRRGRRAAGRPRVRVIAGEQAHVTVEVACRLLGLGAERIRFVAADDQGRMLVRRARDELARARRPGDRLRAGRRDQHRGVRPDRRDRRRLPRARRVVPRGRRLRAVGGGQPGAARPGRRRRAGRLVGDRRPQVAQRALRLRHRRRGRPGGPPRGDDVDAPPTSRRTTTTSRGGFDWTPEFSRRARGVPVYAALRSLGRTGVADLVDRCCDRAHADGRAAGGRRRRQGGSTTSSSTRSSCGSATTTRRRTRSSRASSRTARAG